MLSAADFAVIAVYAVLMTWVGLVARRRTSGVEEYFAAGHKLPWWMATISHHVSGYSAFAWLRGERTAESPLAGPDPY